MSLNAEHNIYIHVPYCISKCNYCAFFSTACANPDWEKYSTEIITEIKHWGQILGDIRVPTIFFGGGTPSLMPTKIFGQIIDTIATTFRITNDAEVSIEANPGTLGATRLNEFVASGVNRLSVGVQSLDDDKLRYLGRRHSARDALCLLDAGAAANIRVSADFIYALPTDTVSDVVRTCLEINKLGLKHCSMYELTIEPNTPLARTKPNTPSNETTAQMYMAIADTLNLARYEVSNYAAPGFECRHNTNVWHGAPYIGIGRGAAGRIFINDTWFEQMGAGAVFTPISRETRAIEKIITGMRTTIGTELTPDVIDAIDMKYVNAHPELFSCTQNRIAATKQGMLILDEIIKEMVK